MIQQKHISLFPCQKEKLNFYKMTYANLALTCKQTALSAAEATQQIADEAEKDRNDMRVRFMVKKL